ncbi:MAG: DUF3990 domain-containing protein [Victivallales bacterium]|nr:DUF3990 domain-containing protein [Victivallales bacterium]
MKVYHGSTMIINHSLVQFGRLGLDFGQGFYVTTLRGQAEAWAIRMARIRQESGVVNVYEMDMERVKREFKYKQFLEYDMDWLDFIVANRRRQYDGERFDVIEGGVANDRVIDTVEAYMSDLIPRDVALRNLKAHRPNNQLCICNQTVIDVCLKYLGTNNI